MFGRFIVSGAVLGSLAAIDPTWIVVDWSDPGAWVTASRAEDVAAALVRQIAMWLAASQLLALSLLAAAQLMGSRDVGRLAHRVLLPALRGVAPLALVAGSTLPVAASEARLPILPPTTSPTTPHVPAMPVSATRPVHGERVVIVKPGDSMWTIAACHTDGAVAPYWVQVVDANRERFDDVNLIRPGDDILLPPVNPRD
jgi:nucleoid-associated protein YgaU